MTSGTLTLVSQPAKEASHDKTLDCDSSEIRSSEDRIQSQLLEQDYMPGQFISIGDMHFGDANDIASDLNSHLPGSPLYDWNIQQSEVHRPIVNVWDTPKMKSLLAEPLGTPVALTKEEAIEIVRLAAGRRPDLPAGEDVVKEVRELLGHSLMERLKRMG